MKIPELYKIYSQHYLVDTDTRKIRNKTIFFALKGDNFNGNEYAGEALKKGALFSVVDEEKYQTNDRIVLVNNVLETLQNLANYHRNKLGIPIIGLTGSNGKTTTKELINVILSKEFKTTATVGNLNNHIGVPLTLLSMTPETEIGIVEMGANHHKEIELLCKITEPDYGYITNFGKAHIEGFGSIEGVVKAKSELYDYLRSNNKTAFVNTNDSIQVNKTKDIIRVLFDDSVEYLGVNPLVELKYKSKHIQSNLIGKYNYNNIVAAITIGVYFGVTIENIKKAIEGYFPKNNRSQIVESNSNKVILDAYNANPTSMKVALESFEEMKSLNKTIILGDMFELGETSEIEHQKIVDLAAKLNFDNMFFVGEIFFKTKTFFSKFKTLEELKEYFLNHSIKDNTILIKGSRGMALERILEVI